MVRIAMVDYSFFVGSIIVQKGQLNSDVVVAGILVLLSVVEASSEAW